MHANTILAGNSEEVFTDLLTLNGSSAGASPKAMIGVNTDKSVIIHGVSSLPDNFEHWLVKFPNIIDGKDSGAIEYVYSQMARNAGVAIDDTYLFPAKQGPGYFAIKRFDRDQNKKLHLHTACGLLHSDFRTPSLDYADLIKATLYLTKDNNEALKMYRLAVFNVLARNRDDHAKNFSFLMDAAGKWKLAPAYDLTFSAGPGGEHSTMVMGEGRNPSSDHLVELASVAGISEDFAREIIAKTQGVLSEWRALAGEVGVLRSNIDLIAGLICPAKK